MLRNSRQLLRASALRDTLPFSLGASSSDLRAYSADSASTSQPGASPLTATQTVDLAKMQQQIQYPPQYSLTTSMRDLVEAR
jgi:hypothetical protein